MFCLSGVCSFGFSTFLCSAFNIQHFVQPSFFVMPSTPLTQEEVQIKLEKDIEKAKQASLQTAKKEKERRHADNAVDEHSLHMLELQRQAEETKKRREEKRAVAQDIEKAKQASLQTAKKEKEQQSTCAASSSTTT
jgi:hypothetical protein